MRVEIKSVYREVEDALREYHAPEEIDQAVEVSPVSGPTETAQMGNGSFRPCMGPRAEDPHEAAQWMADRALLDFHEGDVHLMESDSEDASINSLDKVTRIRVAMDSGSCRNVTHPNTLPAGIKITRTPTISTSLAQEEK